MKVVAQWVKENIVSVQQDGNVRRGKNLTPEVLITRIVYVAVVSKRQKYGSSQAKAGWWKGGQRIKLETVANQNSPDEVGDSE